MNIQGIQIAQGLLARTLEGKLNSAKGNASAESNIPAQEINLPGAKENKILPENSNLSNKQGDALKLFYPPFLPLGNTQGIYEALMESKPEPKQQPSTAEVQAQKKAETVRTKAGGNGEGKQVAEKKDMTVESKPPEADKSSRPGSVLDLKV